MIVPGIMLIDKGSSLWLARSVLISMNSLFKIFYLTLRGTAAPNRMPIDGGNAIVSEDSLASPEKILSKRDTTGIAACVTVSDFSATLFHGPTFYPQQGNSAFLPALLTLIGYSHSPKPPRRMNHFVLSLVLAV